MASPVMPLPKFNPNVDAQSERLPPASDVPIMHDNIKVMIITLRNSFFLLLIRRAMLTISAWLFLLLILSTRMLTSVHYFIKFAIVAIKVASPAIVVPTESHWVSVLPLFSGFVGTIISQPGSILALCPTRATVPFMYMI